MRVTKTLASTFVLAKVFSVPHMRDSKGRQAGKACTGHARGDNEKARYFK